MYPAMMMYQFYRQHFFFMLHKTAMLLDSVKYSRQGWWVCTRAKGQTIPRVCLPGSLASSLINYCFVGESINPSLWWGKVSHTVLQNYLALLAPYTSISILKLRLFNAVKKYILNEILIRLLLLNLLDLFGRKFLFLYFSIQKHSIPLHLFSSWVFQWGCIISSIKVIHIFCWI